MKNRGTRGQLPRLASFATTAFAGNALPATGSSATASPSNLAETGSSSATPMIAAAGAAAVALGVGAIFIVRRRKSGPVG